MILGWKTEARWFSFSGLSAPSVCWLYNWQSWCFQVVFFFSFFLVSRWSILFSKWLICYQSLSEEVLRNPEVSWCPILWVFSWPLLQTRCWLVWRVWMQYGQPWINSCLVRPPGSDVKATSTSSYGRLNGKSAERVVGRNLKIMERSLGVVHVLI